MPAQPVFPLGAIGGDFDRCALLHILKSDMLNGLLACAHNMIY